MKDGKKKKKAKKTNKGAGDSDAQLCYTLLPQPQQDAVKKVAAAIRTDLRKKKRRHTQRPCTVPVKVGSKQVGVVKLMVTPAGAMTTGTHAGIPVIVG